MNLNVRGKRLKKRFAISPHPIQPSSAVLPQMILEYTVLPSRSRHWHMTSVTALRYSSLEVDWSCTSISSEDTGIFPMTPLLLNLPSQGENSKEYGVSVNGPLGDNSRHVPFSNHMGSSLPGMSANANERCCLMARSICRTVASGNISKCITARYLSHGSHRSAQMEVPLLS